MDSSYRKTAPFRQGLSSPERKLVDEILNDGSDSSIPTPVRPPSSADEGLVSSVISRLSTVEAECSRLSRENQTLRFDLQESAHENTRLNQQISDMETFLNDYGLIWVGEDEIVQEKPPAPLKETLEFDMDIFIAKVKELNLIAGEGTAKIESKDASGRIHVFKHARGLALSIYANGLMIRRGPFRSYQQDSTREFIHDVLDGYFPSEFKTEYPDGVIFDLNDKRNVTYQHAFTGDGKRVGRFKSLADLGNPELKLSANEFLNRLPASVIRQGQVISIRSDIAERLKPPSRDQNISTLRIRGADDETIVLKLAYETTIGQVFEYIKKDSSFYQLRTTFPNRTYPDETETLQAAGLVPNATLFIQSSTK